MSVIHHSIFTTAIALVVTCSATDIETTNWGIFWKRGSLAKEIPANLTPGSDSCDTMRIAIPQVYAFLDCYDTRGHCGAGYNNFPATPPHTNTTARFVHLGDCYARKEQLLQMSCDPTNELGKVIWGSSALDSVLPTNAPVQTDFTWTQNPTDLCYKEDIGTRWMPCFYSIWEFEGQNPRGESLVGGLASKGWLNVILEEPGSDTFSSYVYRAATQGLGGRPATPNTGFIDIAKSTFTTADELYLYDLLYRYEGGYRLSYQQFASLSQILSLFDRSYHIPGDLISVTNDYCGRGEVVYKFSSYDTVTVSIDSEGNVTKGWGAGDIKFTYDSEESHIYATNKPCAYKSPRAIVSQPYAEADAIGYCLDTATAELGCQDILDYLCNTVGTYRLISRRYQGDEKLYAHLETFSGETVGTEHAFTQPWFDEGDYEIGDIYGHVSCAYKFHNATDVHVQRNAGVHWNYPSNVTYLANCDQTFMMSYVATANYALSENDSIRKISFYWTETIDDWKSMLGYGYASKIYSGVFPLEYPANLGFALQICKNKCVDTIGTEFFTDPHYCAYSLYEANNLIDNIQDEDWKVKFNAFPASGSSPISFTNEVSITKTSDRGIVMEPEHVVIGELYMYITGEALEKTVQPPISVQTDIKGIIQANWDFPQLKRSNP